MKKSLEALMAHPRSQTAEVQASLFSDELGIELWGGGSICQSRSVR